MRSSFGLQAQSGHYTAYIRYGDQWYFADDSVITPITPQEMEKIAQQGYGTNQSHTVTTFSMKRNEANCWLASGCDFFVVVDGPGNALGE